MKHEYKIDLCSLAYAEMRLILTRFLWKFDIEPLPGWEEWDKQRVYLLWEKKGLKLKLSVAAHVPADA